MGQVPLGGFVYVFVCLCVCVNLRPVNWGWLGWIPDWANVSGQVKVCVLCVLRA